MSNEDEIVEVARTELDTLRAVAMAAQTLIDYEWEGRNEQPHPYTHWDAKFEALSDALGRLK